MNSWLAVSVPISAARLASCARSGPTTVLLLAILEPQTRAAVTGATTTTAGWASELVGQAVGEFVSTLPGSAASKLIARGMQINFPSGACPMKIPTRRPVRLLRAGSKKRTKFQRGNGSSQRGPSRRRRSGLLLAFPRELANHSSAEEILTTMLREDASHTIAPTFSAAQRRPRVWPVC